MVSAVNVPFRSLHLNCPHMTRSVDCTKALRFCIELTVETNALLQSSVWGYQAFADFQSCICTGAYWTARTPISRVSVFLDPASDGGRERLVGPWTPGPTPGTSGTGGSLCHGLSFNISERLLCPGRCVAMDSTLGNRMLKEVEEFTLEQVSGCGCYIESAYVAGSQ